MKKILNRTLEGVLLALVLMATSGHATLFVSNLDEEPAGVGTIDKDQWIASPFRTDNSAAAFTLDNIVLSLDGGDGTNQFSVALYEDAGNKPSFSPYAILLGDNNPEDAGEYTYLPNGVVTLLPNTIYWVAARVTSGLGLYDWNYTGGGTTSQWEILNLVSFHQDGEWSASLSGPQMFGVSASPLPEPTILTLAVLGGFLVPLARRRRPFSK